MTKFRLMTAIETPVQQCFSSDSMEGAWYHEYNESNNEPHSFHRYDNEGVCILYSTKTLPHMTKERIFYLSDRFGTKL